MGTFFLIFGILLFLSLAGLLSQALGFWGPYLFGLLVLSGVITAIWNAWSRLNKRLDRIEKALGVTEEPEKRPEEEDGPGADGDPV